MIVDGQSYIPRYLIWLTAVACLGPLLLNLAGIDFGLQQPASGIVGIFKGKQLFNLHNPSNGAFVHLILSGISVVIASLIGILALVDYAIKREIGTPIIGMALFCTGILDVFHMLASTQLIEAYNPSLFNPLFWVLTRIFHALMLILGVVVFVTQSQKVSPSENKTNKRLVIITGLVFGLLTLTAISFPFLSKYHLKMIFPEHLLSRPYELLPIACYTITGFFFLPKFYEKCPSAFSKTLLLSLFPVFIMELYMLTSKELFDNNYLIAHFIKPAAFLIPFMGLSLNYLQAHHNEKKIIKRLNKEVKERVNAEIMLLGVLDSSLSGIMAYRSIRAESNEIVDFECTMLNAQSERFTGTPSRELLGKKFSQIWPQSVKDTMFKQYVHVVETGEVLNFEYTLTHLAYKNWFHIVAIKLDDGFTVTLTDITKRKRAEEELQESKQKFEAVFNQTFEFISLLSLEGHVIDLNETALSITGIKRTDFIGEPFESLPVWFESNDAKKQLTYAVREAANGNFIRFEAKVIGIKNKILTIDFSVKPILNEKGKINLLIAEGRDITEQKEANMKIFKSETLMAEAQKIVHLGSWEWNINTTRSLTWSDELYRIYGLEPGSSINSEQFIKSIHPEDVEYVKSIIDKALETKEPFSFEHRIIRPEGKVRTLLCKGHVLTHTDGSPSKMLGIGLDVTDQKEANREILKSIGLYRTMAKNMPNSAVFLFDQSLTLTLADGMALTQLGLEKNILGKKATHIYDEDLREELIPLLENAFSGKETTFEKKINNEFFIIHVLPVRNSEKEIFSCMMVVHDISQMKKTQEELELRIEELNRSNKDLEQFAYVASHDLQEPLRKIRAFGDRLESQFADQLGEEGVDYVDRMQSAARRMQTLIEDLLTFSRLSRDTQPYLKLNCLSMIKDILTDLEVTIEQKNAVIQIPDKMHEVEGVAGQINQLFQNLISNALKFTKPATVPLIEITSTLHTEKDFPENKGLPSGKYCKISIQDNGIGFDEKYLERIFIIFQRLHGRNEYEGTGIGLAICKKIVENHNGFITAKSKINEGSTFSVVLPLKQKKHEKHN